MKSTARILLILACILAILPLVHHHGLDSAEHASHRADFCVLTTLEKAASSDAAPPIVFSALRSPERLQLPVALSLPTATIPRGLSPRAPPLG